mmetsp:Transcript_14406/g.20293  ORF Transcript_14406/g.20293 Transcript_14406/m.20293 type:complete len:514 (+) Transcript_14406:48-1589(+)
MKLSFAVSTLTSSAVVVSMMTMMNSMQGAHGGEVVLSEKIMKISRDAAELSSIAYFEKPAEEPTLESMVKHYEDLKLYIHEPDEALVAKKDGYCYGAFRGTTLTSDDWRQNLRLGTEPICADDGVCCETRQGFFDAYDTPYRAEWEQGMRDCAETCTNKEECVILTGHSQGGAIATVAAVALGDLDPYVITFGQPYTVDAPCEKISSERFYRFINSEGHARGIEYDPVPFLPGFGADAFGHTMILSDDFTGVAYVGLDAQDYFSPLDVTAAAHSMRGTEEDPGYLDRLNTLMDTRNNNTYPIRNDGYVAGSLCSKDKECQSEKCESETKISWSRCVGIECTEDDDCDTKRCDSGVCIPKLGSCQHCDEDTDCKSGKCLGFPIMKCSGANGLMDTECECFTDKDCATGRCEGYTPPTCEALLPVGAKCNEHSDCQSGDCSWRFVCNAKEATTRSINLGDEAEGASGSNESGKGGHAFLSTVLVVIAVGGIGYFGYKQYAKRQAGYAEIPASLDV